MADALTTIGWLFQAKDLASGVVTKAVSTVQKASKNMHKGLKTTGDVVDEMSRKVVASLTPVADTLQSKVASAVTHTSAIIKTEMPLINNVVDKAAMGMKSSLTSAGNDMIWMAEGVGNSFTNVFGDLHKTAFDPVVKGAQSMADGVTGSIQDMGKTVSNFTKYLKNDAFDDAFYGIASGIFDSVDAVAGGFKKIKKAVFETEHSFADWGASVGAVFTDATSKGKELFGFLGTTALTGLGKLQSKAVSAGVNFGKMFSVMGGMQTLAKGMKASGGIFGALLGPLAPLMKLVEPLISMLSDFLRPFIDTFSGVVKNAFGPFQEILEIIATTLGQKVSKFIGPLASMLEVMAVHLGSIVTSMFEGGKAGGMFGKFMPVIKEIGKTLMDVGKDLMPILKEVFGVLMKTASDILPDVAKILKKLLPPIVKLAGLLFTKVFAPLYIGYLKTLGKLIKVVFKGLVVFADWLAPFIEGINIQLTDFFGNFSNYMKAFYYSIIKPFFIDPFVLMGEFIKNMWANYIQPFVDKILGFRKTIMEALGLGDLDDKMKGLVGGVVAAITAPIEALKGVVNSALGVVNAIMTAKIPLIGKLSDVGAVKALLGNVTFPLPMLATGAARVDTPSIAGEAGPEMVIPLRPDTVQKNLGPLLPQLDMGPMLDALVGIERKLGGILRVSVVGDAGGNSMSGGGGGGSNAPIIGIESAVGFMGV